MDGRVCFFNSCPKDFGIVGQEHGDQGGRDVQSWSKDYADIPDRHFIDIRIIDDVDKEGREGLYQFTVHSRQLMNKNIESCNLLLSFIKVYANQLTRSKFMGVTTYREL